MSPDPLPPINPPPFPPPADPCADCDPCKNAAGFSLLYCEDGRTHTIAPPLVKAYLVYDPSLLPGIPYTWAPYVAQAKPTKSDGTSSETSS